MRFLSSIYVHLKFKMRDEGGATMVEYALMVALIALVAFGAVTNLGTTVSPKFTEAATGLGG